MSPSIYEIFEAEIYDTFAQIGSEKVLKATLKHLNIYKIHPVRL